MTDRTSLRMSAVLLLTGQVLYILVTQFHAGGQANDHPAIFAAYAASGIWKAVHIGQFVCAAILLVGLLALPFAVNADAGGRGGRADSVPFRRLWRWLCTASFRRSTASATRRSTTHG